VESRTVETRGGRTKIRVYEGGSGEPLLFLHGAGGLLPDDPFLAALARRFRVSAPLLPGYEDSEGADSLRTMLDVTLWAFDVIEALGLERPRLVGHSMGGMIAAEMAAVCPHDVERLALIAPAGLWLESHPIPDLFALLPFELPALLFHDPGFGAKLMTGGLLMEGGPPGPDLDFARLLQRFEDSAFLQRYLLDNARRLGTAGKILFPIPERGLAERLYRVRAETLLLWGESDRLIPPVYAEAFQRLLPRARLVRVAEAGHMLPYERPDAVIEALGGLSTGGRPRS
jgi:pimeloyl-ACP methyl ester carboxylesterase